MKQKTELTFKYNQERGRHGWLRLTPAYSVKAVLKFLNITPGHAQVLDPFSGTGTTGLLCSELGIYSTLIEINPFLVWFAKTKTRNYSPKDLSSTDMLAQIVTKRTKTIPIENPWIPPIHNIERWWTFQRLKILAQLFSHICDLEQIHPPKSIDLLKVGFCRTMIKWSNAAFDHQSMSFKDKESIQPPLFELDEIDERDQILNSFTNEVAKITQTAQSPLPIETQVIQGDARHIDKLVDGTFTQVVTSPPYPNRMSYIRELRPYMYWLGFLETPRQAGELDWQAIGGTWGIATSRLNEWTPPRDNSIEHQGFYEMVKAIAETPNSHSKTLANYIHKYFVDSVQHLSSLRSVLEPGAEIVYIVGNSKFYDVLVPVEQIYASIMQQCGFHDTRIELLRKRNSKQELYEYAVISYV